MAEKPVLYGFDASTYVRSVRMLLAAKGVVYDQVPVNVLSGEAHGAAHLARHPFGKVPVLDIDAMRLYETAAILRYVDEARDGPRFSPDTAKGRARDAMAYGIADTYGYASLIGGVAAYHLFPDLVGGQNEDARAKGIATGTTVLAETMRLRGPDPFIAGARPGLSDLVLAPIVAYVAMTPDAGALLGGAAVTDWWNRIQALEVFAATAPDPG